MKEEEENDSVSVDWEEQIKKTCYAKPKKPNGLGHDNEEPRGLKQDIIKNLLHKYALTTNTSTS